MLAKAGFKGVGLKKGRETCTGTVLETIWPPTCGKLGAAPQLTVPTMQTRTFTTGRIRKVVYDPATQQLDLHWDSKTIQAYKQVPAEVYRRLCSAPNPTTYWEDRIAEEYPKGTPMKQPGGGSGGEVGAGKSLSDLFGALDNPDGADKP